MSTVRFRHPALASIAKRLPAFQGSPIRIRFQPELTARGGQVESRSGRGREVHAASFLRRREMVLDLALLRRRRELARIFVHELFHFAWLRIGNKARREYELLLSAELEQHARGEMGWSAERSKQLSEQKGNRGRLWREYICESYCDTAAWVLGGQRHHGEVTLANRFRTRRLRWFRAYLSQGPILL